MIQVTHHKGYDILYNYNMMRNAWTATIWRDPKTLTYNTDWAGGTMKLKEAEGSEEGILSFVRAKIDQGFTIPKFENEQHLARLA